MTDLQRQHDELCINTMRMLSIDAIQQAKSGHPGLPLGAAPAAYVLWMRFLKHNPRNPCWPNRDRYVHSAGHGSALLYALLHLTGYDISLEDMKKFRQWQSTTPGHPEYEPCRGIECTTGPLGQGFGMGVGMALAERFLAAQFNRPGFPVIDHYTYGIVSDGDLMEGISSEAASLAGHLRLGKLVYLYDDNQISIEGGTAITFTEDVAARFAALGWHVQRVADGNDLEAITAAIKNARAETGKPSLIAVRTHIGFGSPKQGSPSAHGEPLGEEALAATKEFFKWPQEPRFFVPDNAVSCFSSAQEVGQKHEEEWLKTFAQYAQKFPAEAAQLERLFAGELPEGWRAEIPLFKPEDGPIATRAASGKVLNALAKRVPNLVGGSADLAPSTKTLIAGAADQGPDAPEGRNIRFGVREHAMGTAVNGMALHGGVIPYAATFLVFADYMRPPLRLSALMNIHSIFVFTHDSIAVGEDGPTHQPVEHLICLRAIPNLRVVRPADANETAVAWEVALEHTGPTVLILTRQKLPVLDQERFARADGLKKGAYVLSDCQSKADILLIATGSEVSLALQAQEKLAGEGIHARVVSMPCWELFVDQPQEYQDAVLPPEVTTRLSIEAGSSIGWKRWVGDRGDSVSVDRFGASAPGPEVMRQYGFSVDNVTARAMALIRRER
ncbi:MAG: transketolase [Desulfomonile tiedjei]|nr:transketolase [Desulfomonile tiedjei]